MILDERTSIFNNLAYYSRRLFLTRHSHLLSRFSFSVKRNMENNDILVTAETQAPK